MGFLDPKTGPTGALRIDHVCRMLFQLHALRIRSALRIPKP